MYLASRKISPEASRWIGVKQFTFAPRWVPFFFSEIILHLPKILALSSALMTQIGLLKWKVLNIEAFPLRSLV